MPELLEIIGQDTALVRLQQALGASRMPHAYLFVGPEGVGRRTTATALGRTLLCENPQSKPNRGRLNGLDDDFPLQQACGQCADCGMMSAGTHPDFHPVYKELARHHEDPNVRKRVMQELGIAVIRSFLIAPASRAPMRGRGKVFVVLEAELMSTAAQNALLKTLEEPPKGVTIILTCRQAEQMLPTTLSRCATVRFELLPRPFVTKKLLEKGIAEEQANFWAAFTAGAIGRASRLAEDGMYQIKRDILERLGFLGPAGDAELSEHLVKVTDKLAAAAVKKSTASAGTSLKVTDISAGGAAEASKTDEAALSKMLASRRAAGTMLELIAGAFRDALHMAAGSELAGINADQPHVVRALVERFDTTQLARIIEQLSEYERLLWRNVNPKIVWDNVVITCASGAP